MKNIQVGLLGIGLGRHEDQRILVRPVPEVAIHRVVAEVGQTALEPVGERRVVVVADAVKTLVAEAPSANAWILLLEVDTDELARLPVMLVKPEGAAPVSTRARTFASSPNP